MRKNFPITSREVKVPANQYLISKTDLKGRITYVNPVFVEISGFRADELLGKAHNIVRHPHMPPYVFLSGAKLGTPRARCFLKIIIALTYCVSAAYLPRSL